MSEFILDLETYGGADARACCERATRIATTLGVTVRFKHNDVEVLVERGSHPEDVYARWRRDFAVAWPPAAEWQPGGGR